MIQASSGVHQVSYSISTAVKQMSHKVFTPPFSAEVRNEWSYVSIPRAPSRRIGKNFTFRNSCFFILCAAVNCNFIKKMKKLV